MSQRYLNIDKKLWFQRCVNPSFYQFYHWSWKTFQYYATSANIISNNVTIWSWEEFLMSKYLLFNKKIFVDTSIISIMISSAFSIAPVSTLQEHFNQLLTPLTLVDTTVWCWCYQQLSYHSLLPLLPPALELLGQRRNLW